MVHGLSSLYCSYWSAYTIDIGRYCLYIWRFLSLNRNMYVCSVPITSISLIQNTIHSLLILFQSKIRFYHKSSLFNYPLWPLITFSIGPIFVECIDLNKNIHLYWYIFVVHVNIILDFLHQGWYGTLNIIWNNKY